MLKIFLIFSLAICTSVFASEYDKKVEAQCKYMVDGVGKDDSRTSVYMASFVTEIVYKTDFAYLTELAKKSTKGYTMLFACKEALLDTRTLGFDAKFKNGLSITVDTRYAKYSRLAK